MRRTFTARINRFVWPVVAFACLAILAFDFNSLAADNKEERKLVAPNISGAWTLFGRIAQDGTVEKLDDTEGEALKFFSNGRWCVTSADPETGLVENHHGGTYTLKGNKYAESTKYASESRRSLINKTFHFKVHADADTLTQIGIDNDFNEVWKRVKSDKR